MLYRENNRPIKWYSLSVTYGRSVVFSIQHYVIQFVSDLRQVGGFLYTTLCDTVCQWLTAGRWFSLYNIIWYSLSVTYGRSVVFSIQHYVIQFISDLRQVGGFISNTSVSSTNKTDRHDITEILLKVALNTINHINCIYFLHTPAILHFLSPL
jgi:hypothetical protein